MRKIDKILQRSAEIDNPLLFTPQDQEASLSHDAGNKSIPKNFFVLWVIISVILFLLLGRTFYLQVVRGKSFQEMAENNRIRALVIKAPRGLIVDRSGEVLARNVPSFDAVFSPADLPKEYGDRRTIYEKLSEIIGMNRENIEAIIESSDLKSKEGFLLKENIGYDAALLIEETHSSLKGIYVDKTARRDYVDGSIFSPLIGYDGKITKEELIKNPDYLMTDYIGKNGLEYTYEKYLHGTHGQYRMEVDSNGNIKENLGVSNPVPGDELVLHVDAKLQRKITEVLNRIMEENKDATGASVVAINPKSGGVLALVNAPSYDNNLFAGGISSDDYSKLMSDERRPMTNRAISGEYAPGSTFKPMMAAAALEEKIITENTTVGCHGNISVGSWSFPDWKTHGPTDVKKAIAESCDVFF